MSNFPIISVGLVNILSIGIKFFSKTTLDPRTKKIARNEKIIKFKSKLKLPLFTSLSFLAYLEKSPKFTITIEKYAKKVLDIAKKSRIKVTKKQINELKPDENILKEKIKKFREDELHHKDIAYEEGATKKGLYKILDKIIKTGSKVAINISEKI